MPEGRAANGLFVGGRVLGLGHRLLPEVVIVLVEVTGGLRGEDVDIGGICGDGSGKYSDTRTNTSQNYTRTLVFDGFDGAFDAPVISRFDKIKFADDSDVVFGSASLKLGGVETWQFGLGSSLVWNNAVNNFAGDALIFGEAEETITTDWEVMSSNNNKIFAGWDQANIMLFGVALDTYDDDTCTWSAEGFGYVAKWDDEDHKIIIAQA